MKCPNCGHESNAAFCSECGTPLKGARCKNCDAQLLPGAQFCTSCGTPVREKTSNLAWYVAGVALLALLAVLLVPGLRRATTSSDDQVAAGPTQDQPADAAPPAAGPFQGGGGGSPPPLTGTPREQADRLFNRIMQTREGGDTARAKFFLPMGIQAYKNAAPLDDDGLYHLSLLQGFSGDGAGARQTAEQVLQHAPAHLLALIAAAEAARIQGDNTAAKAYYRKFLANYDSERKKNLPEYQDHDQILPAYQAEARKFIG
jgi:hypothetical protein